MTTARVKLKLKILNQVTTYYLESGDFKGTSISSLVKKSRRVEASVRGAVAELIQEGHIQALFSDVEDNTHIIRFGFEVVALQLSKIQISDRHHTCIYPSQAVLKAKVSPSNYANRPFELALALGHPQLEFRVFELSILEAYRNDPRYHYDCTDIDGSISLRDEHFSSGNVREQDRVLLQTFGFAYDEEFNRYVTVMLRYLADLTPEHQRLWETREMQVDFKVHPDYFRNIHSVWGEGISIFGAFLIELDLINQMANAMQRPSLFKNTWKDTAPRRFNFLIRPTLTEFNQFVLLLDQMLSDNINQKFFLHDITFDELIPQKDGTVIKQRKGSLRVLDDWIRAKVRLRDWTYWDKAIATLKLVRKKRQEPAHYVNEDTFDMQYIREQRDLIVDVYSAVRSIRMILSLSPQVKSSGISAPEFIEDNKIWVM